MTRTLIFCLLMMVVFPFVALAQGQQDLRDLRDVRDLQNVSWFNRLPSPVGIRIVPFDEADLQNPRDWKSQFTNVIWINKAAVGPEAQTLKFFVHGELKLVTHTSTGREQQEHGSTSPRAHEEHLPSRDYFSTTPVGYFTPEYLDIHHQSQLWGSLMPFAVFFNGGIAVHQAPNGTEDRLGHRASGGCVRISRTVAPWVFHAVEAAGSALVPKFSVTGKPVTRWNGDFERVTAYDTLVIVEERN